VGTFNFNQPARLLMPCAKFREQSELFNILALYCLGTGNFFCSCPALCHVSVLHIHGFSYTFLDAMVEIQGEYINLPKNMMELRRTSKYYKAASLPSCFGSMDVVHVKWSSCPTGDHNHAKSKAEYSTLAFQ
jgi:hypothetical protein